MPMIPEDQGGLLDNPILDAVAVGADDLVKLTVPARTRWKVWELHMVYTAKAVGGNRTVEVEKFTEDDETMGKILAPLTLATTETLLLVMSLHDQEPDAYTLARERPMQHPFLMKAGHYIQVLDTAGIDNLDTVEWRGIVEEWIEG